ncbi:hypothetical protein C8R45DRAFT_1178329 [Mycena sanguinolenta]|nr:hypothetical protein C8R45DRAFT_1178329 [Mycena sanguinolenta]
MDAVLADTARVSSTPRENETELQWAVINETTLMLFHLTTSQRSHCVQAFDGSALDMIFRRNPPTLSKIESTTRLTVAWIFCCCDEATLPPHSLPHPRAASSAVSFPVLIRTIQGQSTEVAHLPFDIDISRDYAGAVSTTTGTRQHAPGLGLGFPQTAIASRSVRAAHPLGPDYSPSTIPLDLVAGAYPPTARSGRGLCRSSATWMKPGCSAHAHAARRWNGTTLMTLAGYGGTGLACAWRDGGSTGQIREDQRRCMDGWHPPRDESRMLPAGAATVYGSLEMLSVIALGHPALQTPLANSTHSSFAIALPTTSPSPTTSPRGPHWIRHIHHSTRYDS